ncbi:DEAD/DEAH box helicase [Enterococcus faecalis]|uniref:DEAD/DEAH box helicase n=1 Tax=Enterococcus TaxID=1350 RepID=UPI00045AD2B4|nr:DEAD/DEAH box helicase [Enterococcus faecalis]EGO2681484.1 DEAD/DEAH box helicase [Enterococcus faecalis]EGO5236011.1 DEAD/DEAH box helicase [Enterococcus faecalis]EHB5048799.1 DEAD/DEAH box helicase [Enterococcus faecalis]EKJ0747279.1 DEAD/DEAH box helicase [Enterococcus faecalis]EME5444051.1 DEAD/DEAH box helicase [Enterococcus faecalis]
MEIEVQKILKIKKLESIEDSFKLAKYVSSRVDDEEARRIIIHVLEIWDNVNAQSKSIWMDLIERAGFYPYLNDKDETSLGIQAKIRKQWYKSEHLEGVFFHAKQKIIEQKIYQGKNVAVSAPTSFGKSLLIEEIVARNKFNNILIIQPTLALIDETRRKMSKYNNYNLVVNTLQEPRERNIFILTAERVLEYESLPVVDFFIVDEFYKVSNRRGDERIDVLNIAIHNILSNGPQALFLTPSIDALSDDFINKYDIDFLRTDYSLVNTNVQEVRFKNSKEKKNILFQMLAERKEPSLVYMSSPYKAYSLANEYKEFLCKNNFVRKQVDLPLTEWIDKNISEDWDLKRLLNFRIGVHNGELPRHVVTSQLAYFEEKILDVLFVTTSLIEGVNTSAKTMFIFETKKAKTKIDFFDYSNIKGRAGRMNKFFTGDVFIFGDIPTEEDFKIDVPFVEQKEISDEVLVNLDDDIKEEHNNRVDNIKKNIPEDLMELIKKNVINIAGQKNLYRYIEDNYQILMPTLIWSGIPDYLQLSKSLYLVYRFLESENINVKYTNMLASRSLSMVNSVSLKKVINEHGNYLFSEERKKKNITSDNISTIEKNAKEKAIREILRFARKDAGYKIPKLLNVLRTIQEYVYSKHQLPFGDYSYFSARLENEQVDERLRMFIDFGVPTSAIRSISKVIPGHLESETDIINYIKINFQSISQNLIEYEKKLLFQAINNGV